MKEFLQKYVEKHPDRSYIVDDNGELIWEKVGVDTSKVDVNNIDDKLIYGILANYFFYEDNFE